MPAFPPRLLFRSVVSCPHLPVLPRPGSDPGVFSRIPALPQLAELDGETPFATVHVAWSDSGIYIAAQVTKTNPVVCDRHRPLNGDCLQVIIDTRAVQTVHRATRFCHLFVLLPAAGAQGGSPLAWQAEIPGSRDEEREPQRLCRPEDIVIAADTATSRGRYTLEALFPARILTGYEPTPGARLGFQYLIHDTHLGTQTYSVGAEFPALQDPSLWGLLELAP